MQLLKRLAAAVLFLCVSTARAQAAPVITTAQSELPAVTAAREGFAFGAYSGIVTTSQTASATACIANPAGSGVVVVLDSVEISGTGAYNVTVYRNMTISGGTTATIGNLFGATASGYTVAAIVTTGSTTAITTSGGAQIAGTYNAANSQYYPITTSGVVGLQPGQNACYIGQSQAGVGTMSMTASIKWFERPLGSPTPH